MPFSSYMQDRLGTAVISPEGPLEAGAHVPLTITYTAGHFGIDDTGSIKISWRTASDSGKPQMTDPAAANYTTAHASNGAKLHVEYSRNNIRPWGNTLFLRVMSGFLRAGDQIVIKLGDPSAGSPGYRLQTCCDEDFQFRTFVDAFATYDFVPLPVQPTLRLVSGKPVLYKAHLPTLRRVGERFRLAIVPEDRWGNPSDRADHELVLRPSVPLQALPERISFKPGNGPFVIEDLALSQPADLRITVESTDGRVLGRSNPLRVVADSPFVHYWGDLHGQSKETVGTNPVQSYFAFARDKAFVDMVGHQGNDFQIDDELWAEINRLAAEYDEPGKFVAMPSYEWSGNTGMGGDHNVYYFEQNRPIRRSSRVLLPDTRDHEGTDCYKVGELFEQLEGEDAVVLAHVGGRYADIGVGHDGRFKRSVEIHSCWGTFEWILHDSFRLGHRVGLVCHSDDHKGRPGAAYPGASTFGAIGGLTCYLMDELDRKTLFATLRKRRHYGTTGTRLFLDVRARFTGEAERFEEDPQLGPTASTKVHEALMGDIVKTGDAEIELAIDVAGSAPIERITVFNGDEAVELRRPHGSSDLGRRVRVIWEGAEYRGRSREVYWQGHCRFEGNRFERAKGFNLFNVDKPLTLAADGSRIGFDSVTTGNFAGFDVWLEDGQAGDLVFQSGVVAARIPIAEIGLEDRIFEGGGLGKRLRVFRLPDEGRTLQDSFTTRVRLRPNVDNPVYVRITQEDGHQAWSSPIYLIP